MLPAIPAEIWIHVSDFLPGRDLSSMLTVNRTFFQLCMDAKYRKIDLDDFSNVKAALKRLQRLRDPAVARRVRHLYVYLDPHPVYRRDPILYEEDSWDHSVAELAEVMQTMTATVACFTAVTSFTFQWTQLPSDEPLGPFFTEVWKTCGSCLQTLTLRAIPPNTLPILLSTGDGVGSLRSLYIAFDRSWQPSMVDSNHGQTVVGSNCLVQFVNKITPTLRDLHIVSYSYEGVPMLFFRHVGHIPNLERLNVVCDTSSPTQNIADFMHFIRNHTVTLQHIQWGYRADGLVLQDYLGTKEFDQVFANLLTLDLWVPRFPDGSAQMVQCISHSADTVTSLILRGHYMTDNEVEMLTRTFMHRQPRSLQAFELQVVCLSLELPQLLARALPRLQRLVFEYKELCERDFGRTPKEVMWRLL